MADYDAIINEAGLEWQVDPRLLKAVMMQESRGDPGAVSKAGARGLMQIMPDTGKGLGMTDLHDPVQNIWAGAKYLAMGLDKEGTPEKALLFYHGGPDWRQKYGPESAAYVPGVQKHYAALAPKPGTATDASGGGSAVAKKDDVDPLSLLPPAPKAGTGGTVKQEPDASASPLDLLPPAPKAATQATTKGDTQAPVAVDDYGRPVPTISMPPSGGLSPLTQLTQEDVVNWLSPKPGTTYGDVLPLARDPGGPLRLALPSIIRNPLLGLTEGPRIEGGEIKVPAVTISPETGALGITPEAAATGSLVANPLRFGAREFVPPGTLNRGADLTGVNPLNPEVAARAAETPRGPVAETGVPAPPPAGRDAVPGQQTQATGAQLTPSYEAIYTPAEEAAYRATAEGKKLLEHQVIGEVDNNSYIPGVTVNQAELEQSVTAARDMKELGIQSKEATEAAKIAAQRNTEARETYSLNTERTPTDIHVREQARQADIERQSAEVFAPENVKGEVSTEPLIKQMREEMNLPRNRENSALQSEMGKLIERLTNEDGTARTMSPEQAWGLRQDIDRMTDKHATTGTDPEARNRRRVAGNLNRVADTLDGEIENMAPGYSGMVATYKAHSEAIREMEVLQGLTAKLKTGAQGTMSFAAMQRFMKNVIDARSTGSMDLNAYKSISPETMQRLWNLRDDLRRSAGALELARAAGSDTAQNILGILKSWGSLGAQGAAHAGAAHLFGAGGPIALRMLQEVTAPARMARTERRNVGRMQQMLNPGTPLRIPPGQENVLSPP